MNVTSGNGAVHEVSGKIRLALPPAPEEGCIPYTPSREYMAAALLDSFVPTDLDFSDWVAEQSRQHALRVGDRRHFWLSHKILELAQLASWCDAGDPETFDDRIEVYDREARDRAYHEGRESAFHVEHGSEEYEATMSDMPIDGGLQHTGDRRGGLL